MRVFIDKGQCISLSQWPTPHGPCLLTTRGVYLLGRPSRTRVASEGIRKLLRDEFNCLGAYSDAKPAQCTELQYLAEEDSSQNGSFRTPSLRNVASRPPYMDAGQFATMEQVIRHYMRAPPTATGRSEITARSSRTPDRIVIRLSESDVQDIAAFLRSSLDP